ncbi:fumarylacetoacetate hydrolase family protein [Gilliamella apicola]|uniref:fumarylacetoacetate hydrolase family protein n=1 Tax=Gilliamella apicola TaxID=1196095 RepID=UPI00080EE744|nr:fumarylacetoacetate hydrolase family protein [Gilliamella apicola]OCG09409.1 5-oxopent-3-ene-1,2,5-tricarboxylate decarboxylase [Gilliamella apicola]ORF46820.1 5-oxopent-3-ene-1,2,5-tricarboxylate decarboxylase [Gilliamella apicola]ORF49735.1 5-oxopent-3-ene-1,2,5-tricarboxylate decarboxylase [Gilliamella apicola]ORF54932.1 5-oxopent-3-ene-1,2,5-tricarboxylate decarboxylase [Gilliamella apicola]ORF54993.1 5-oxopent-3-ene-1,2,5-tricarboxylate decarboxylase [Gilliamella apicola]
MKLVSYLVSGRASFGLLNHNGIVDLKEKLGNKYADLKSLLADSEGLTVAKTYLDAPSDIDEQDITYLPVIPNPNKILCVGMNYAEKRAEFNETSSAPTLFVRFPDSQTGHKTNIIKPAITDELDYEGELAIIIGKEGFRIKPEEALSHVAGYSCYMDGSIRDWQYTWFTAGKNWPSTGAFGPCITTSDEIPDPTVLSLTTYLNGQEMQHDCIKNLVHTVPELISYISTFTRLSPGDVILTGSPGGVGKKRNPPVFMKDGDKIEVEITGIGRLTNYVVAERG